LGWILFRAYISWLLKPMSHNYQHTFLAMLCVKISSVIVNSVNSFEIVLSLRYKLKHLKSLSHPKNWHSVIAICFILYQAVLLITQSTSCPVGWYGNANNEFCFHVNLKSVANQEACRYLLTLSQYSSFSLSTKRLR